VIVGVLMSVGVTMRVDVGVGVGDGVAVGVDVGVCDGVAVGAAGEQRIVKKYVPAIVPSTTTKYGPASTLDRISAPEPFAAPRQVWLLSPDTRNSRRSAVGPKSSSRYASPSVTSSA
jgi:hypothetical protein